MKIISWNCNRALRKKTHFLDELNADILVIQECENPQLSSSQYREWAGDYLWVGDNKNIGLGIFARNGYRLSRLDWEGTYTIRGLTSNSRSLSWDSCSLRSFLPCLVNDKLTLVGVWTKQGNSPTFSYIGQLWKYLQIHRTRLQGDHVVLCGDFNSNAIWDEPDRWWNHSDVVRELKDIGLYSLYHYCRQEAHGAEKEKTFFMHRRLNRPYHIDYFFLSEYLMPSSSIHIPQPEHWLACSDHVPLVITVDI